MSGRAISWKRLFIIQSTLVLGACGGGGGSDSPCQSTVPGLCTSLGVAPTPAVSNFEILPKTLITSDCTTNIPFIFTGGSEPFRVITSDNVLVPVDNVQGLGAKHYFLLSIKSAPLPITVFATVLDSQSRSARADITIASSHNPCVIDPNPLLQVEPASANARVSEIIGFKVSGTSGVKYSVTSNDVGVVTVSPNSIGGGTPNFATFNAQATGVGSTLLTVSGTDRQNVNIRFIVNP